GSAAVTSAAIAKVADSGKSLVELAGRRRASTAPGRAGAERPRAWAADGDRPRSHLSDRSPAAGEGRIRRPGGPDRRRAGAAGGLLPGVPTCRRGRSHRSGSGATGSPVSRDLAPVAAGR